MKVLFLIFVMGESKNKLWYLVFKGRKLYLYVNMGVEN